MTKEKYDPRSVGSTIMTDDCIVHELSDVYERTLQVLKPRLRQLIDWLCSRDLRLPSKKNQPKPIQRSIRGLVIFSTGDWYSQNDLASGNIITLIQYLTGMDVFDAVEWAWDTFIVTTSSDVHERERQNEK